MTASIFLIVLIFIADGVICKEIKSNEMWIANIDHGISAFNDDPDYKVYRNVMDFGCKGDGMIDDTECINSAISSGARCGDNCGSSTISLALVYFPAGKYLISAPIIMYYFTQLVGNANDPPTLLAAENFDGLAVIDSNPYKAWGAQWYTNQNNFFRQVRNFVIDLTLTDSKKETKAIHWQVAQATSLTNIHFVMSTREGTGHQGIWMENGSGGFMADLRFTGGKYGMYIGNQQFLTRNLTFDNCNTAIFIHWNWQWSFKNVKINHCKIGIQMTAPHLTYSTNVGSVLLLESVMTDTDCGILIGAHAVNGNDTSGTLYLDNVQLVNVATGVKDTDGATIVSGGFHTIESWGRGSFYSDQSGTGTFEQGNLPAPFKSPNLLDSEGNFFEKSRPQYEANDVTDFASVRDFGAKGDGVTDDSKAIQEAIAQSRNSKIVYFPAGSYVISKTIYVPGGSRMTGEAWSVLMAHGEHFQNEDDPQPMLEIGHPGEVGDIEMSELFFSVKGPQPGAILVQWNIKGSSQGSAGMWDSHFRVGGTKGSGGLQGDKCPKGQGYNPQCTSAFMLLHLTSSSSAYLENVWAWTADHDLDSNVEQGQITLYTGRGVLIESTEGPVWLYGTQSEHNVFYQYQLSFAKNIFMTMIQSETPYWQPGPKAPLPFKVNPKYNDPSFIHCDPDSTTCNMAWSIRAVGCSNVYIYGAGVYNFFNNYTTPCFDTKNCQDAHVNLEGNSKFYLYNLNTLAATNMIVGNNTLVLAKGQDNSNWFCQSINAFLGQVN